MLNFLWLTCIQAQVSRATMLFNTEIRSLPTHLCLPSLLSLKSHVVWNSRDWLLASFSAKIPIPVLLSFPTNPTTVDSGQFANHNCIVDSEAKDGTLIPPLASESRPALKHDGYSRGLAKLAVNSIMFAQASRHFNVMVAKMSIDGQILA